jgi:hypothetical protein
MKSAIVGIIALVFALSAHAQTTQPNLAKPPEGAIVLFDGTTNEFVDKDGKPSSWNVVDGALEATHGKGDLFGKQNFGDCTLHVEFRTPQPGPNDTGEHRGNSGVFFQKTYEIQILDSFGAKLYKGACGAIYNIRPPDKNMCLAPGEWQSFDITYKAPHFDSDGKKTENARATIIWNGEKVHDNAEIPHATRSPKEPEMKEPGPIELQDHGFKVQFRNIWIVPAKS